MELINTTGLACELTVGLAPEHGDAKQGVITAKATFVIGADGRVVLDTQTPYPFFGGDEETPLGVLPTDMPIRRGPAFEVMLLGAAYAPGGRPATELTVTLSVGSHVRALRVIGDRRWLSGPEGPVLSAPEPFVRMPLTWERAFGGSAEVWLDARSTIELMHARNPRGRGFDPTDDLANLGKGIYVAREFPRTAYERLAPNLEDPERPIRTSADAPEPWCFAPTSVDMGLQMQSVAEHYRPRIERGEDVQFSPELTSLRAHPTWVLAQAPLGAPVILTGCRPEGDLRFVLPSSTPVMDYVIGGRTGSRALTPQSLVLIAEERRFYVVYRHFFFMRPEASEERSIRLRYE